MDTKHDNVVTYHERLLPIKSNYHLNKWSCEVNEIQMKDISPLAEELMSPTLGKVVTYYGRLSPLKSHDPSITWQMCGLLTT